jgi:hypothetical protein
VVADLGTGEGRNAALAGVANASGGVVDGVVTWAEIPGLTDRPGGLLVSVNYFGTVALLEGLRPLWPAVSARPRRPSARTPRPSSPTWRWT